MTEPSATVETRESIELVQFSLLGRWAGVAAAQVAPVRFDAGHIGVVPVETLAGLVPAQTPVAAKRVLLSVLAGQGAGVVVSVENTADLVQMSCAEIHPLPPLLGARHELTGLRALGWLDDGRDDPLVLLFDWCARG
jgi:hypothetical protein